MKAKVIEQKARELYKKNYSLGEISKLLAISLDYLRVIINSEEAKKELKKYRSKPFKYED